ncbi:MAG TPA: CPBP family intramembrane metalloprotease [Flammeovirgaceae bacterium]|nr:CPBP family intramembrane metalloprotease [Flammeovirgaceae bacterium]
MQIKRLPFSWLLLIVLLLPVNQLAINYLFILGAFKPIYKYSHGLLHPTLQGNLISLLIFGFIIFKAGKLRPKDILLTRENFKSGLKWGLIIWLVLQVLVLLYHLYSGRPVVAVEQSRQSLGVLAGQLFGNALLEEMLYRGILLWQIYLLFRKKYAHAGALIFALLISQAIFSLIHIPNRIFVKEIGFSAGDFIRLMLMGIVFALIYLRTANFTFAVIVHSLLNYPTVIIDTELPAKLIVLIATVLLTLFWPLLTGDKNGRALLIKGPVLLE